MPLLAALTSAPRFTGTGPPGLAASRSCVVGVRLAHHSPADRTVTMLGHYAADQPQRHGRARQHLVDTKTVAGTAMAGPTAFDRPHSTEPRDVLAYGPMPVAPGSCATA